ncbi:transport and Golgi organization protein 2 homolog [Galendromus occidentalis]|uniref:Transport and Golgi organization protein 2 homolog n=1 Tax=Galendromus occidentalis TaxID=34638 RepID=A0AAJ6QPH1_9ACAR|nr:transport and Golgi organization protein 2 homolog [Galendromus occidentalis]
MCVLIFYLNPSETSPKGYKLILISIRDELFVRPTAPAHLWSKDPNLIGGMDLEPGREGGAWLIFNKNGRFASLLNILQRDEELLAGKRGRGFLVVDFAKSSSTITPDEYAQSLYKDRENFNGFTLVCVDLKQAYGSYFCSMGDMEVQNLGAGYHAFGNSILPRQWPKVVAGKEKFEEVVEKNKHDEKLLEEALFDLMNDETNHGVDEFMRKQTDEPQDLLTLRGALKFYIKEFNYGSRTHTVVLIRGDGSASYSEKTVEDGKWVERRTDFQLNL